jgi:ribose-phosphate pyrophosphokinase
MEAGMLIFVHPSAEHLARPVLRALGAARGDYEFRRFPDGEAYLRLSSACASRDVGVLATLTTPDDKLLPIAFLTDTARARGARSVGLIAPYLAYMRQDSRFRDGEALTSATFARLLSSSLDWLATIDPHLHRYDSLAEVYAIPTRAIEAAPAIARWVAAEVERPLLVGPDAESAQWVERVAELLGAPCTVLTKERRGDRDVEVSPVDLASFRDHTPVVLDDIISTGHTMLAALERLREAGARPAISIGIHAVFADTAFARLAERSRVVSCNTIVHPSNAIDVSAELAAGVALLLESLPGR